MIILSWCEDILRWRSDRPIDLASSREIPIMLNALVFTASSSVEAVFKAKGVHTEFWLFIKTNLIYFFLIFVTYSRISENPLKMLLVSYYNDLFCYHISIHTFPTGLILLHPNVYALNINFANFKMYIPIVSISIKLSNSPSPFSFHLFSSSPSNPPAQRLNSTCFSMSSVSIIQ